MMKKAPSKKKQTALVFSVAKSPRSDNIAAKYTGLDWLWNHFEAPAFLIAFLFCLLCLAEYHRNMKGLIIGCSFLSLIIILFSFRKGRFKERFSLPMLAVAIYFLLVAVSVCWTCSGKFFLREYSKLLFVLPVFLFIVLLMPKSERSIRNYLFIVCSAGAIYAILSVDLASTKLTWPLMSKIPGVDPNYILNFHGTRLPGIFANSNITGGVLGISLLFSFTLLLSAKGRFRRSWVVFLSSLQTYAFTQGVNRSAILFLLLSFLVLYLLNRQQRFCFFFECLITLLPSVLVSFFALRLYPTHYVGVEGVKLFYPLALMFLSAIFSSFIFLIFSPAIDSFTLGTSVPRRIVSLALIGIVVVFGFLALSLSAPLDISGQSVTRACYPSEDEYSLAVDYTGDLRVQVYSQDAEQTASAANTVLYEGPVQDAVFRVPEKTRVVFFAFSSGSEARITSAAVVGNTKHYKLHLDYPLLPSLLSDRLAGIWATQTLAERLQFFRDGMKIFADYPVFGGGLGAFESLIAGYQEFRYVTRYVHNHYVQVLLDNGIVGLLSYLFILVSSFLCILQGRKEDAPFHALFAPLLAAFVMLVLHSSMDVIMSTTAYLPFAYSLFAICALCWGKPLSKKWLTLFGQVCFSITALAYSVMISLNIKANAIVSSASNNPIKFFSTLVTAIKIDAFEYTDWKISYLTACAQLQSPEYKLRADQYASELLNVPSNSLHSYLVSYYLEYQDYDMALAAAENGARFNYADASTWDGYFNSFESALNANPDALGDIRQITLALYEEFEQSTSAMFRQITLSEKTLAFIERIS